MNVKRGSVLFVVLLLCAALAGCSSPKPDSKLPQNDVVTSIPYDTSKTTITIYLCDGNDRAIMGQKLSEKFPEYNFVFRFASEPSYAIMGNMADLYFAPSAIYTFETERYLLDLSTYDFTNRYYATALHACVSPVDGKQYVIPMPGNITGIVYNMTMFEENGWKVPRSLTEFVNLVKTIDESNTGVKGFQYSLKPSVALPTVLQGFSESGTFDTLDFFQWKDDYDESDDESVRDVLRVMTDTFDFLVANNILSPNDFTVKMGERSIMLYQTRNVAMSIETQRVRGTAAGYGSEDEFGMLPFWSGDEAKDDYVITSPLSYLSVNKNIASDKAKLDAVLKVVDFISTPEGQPIFTPLDAQIISQLKDSKTDFSGNTLFDNVKDAIDAGRIVMLQPIFKSSMPISQLQLDTVFNNLYATSRPSTAVSGEERLCTFDEAVAYLDRKNIELKRAATNAETTVYATVKEPFTVLQTTEYFAQMFKDKAGADIGLCLMNGAQRGNSLAFYQGNLDKTTGSLYDRDALTAYSFVVRDDSYGDDDSKLALFKMTGEQILRALETPSYMGGGKKANFEPFFVAAGLKIEYAPWAEQGHRYLSVRLSDGTALNPEHVYTVAAWNYTIQPEDIIETVMVYPESFQDIFGAQLEKNNELTPFKDNRFTLNWEVRAK